MHKSAAIAVILLIAGKALTQEYPGSDFRRRTERDSNEDNIVSARKDS